MYARCLDTSLARQEKTNEWVVSVAVPEMDVEMFVPVKFLMNGCRIGWPHLTKHHWYRLCMIDHDICSVRLFCAFFFFLLACSVCAPSLPSPKGPCLNIFLLLVGNVTSMVFSYQ